MKRLILLLAIVLIPKIASAQVRVGVRFGWQAPPPLIEVNPGVQIVEDGDQEVFYSGGYYWHERDGNWYRSNDWHDNWQPVRGRRVPMFIRNHQRGSYVHWRGADHPGGWRGDRDRRMGNGRGEHRGDDHRDGRGDGRGGDRHDDHRDARGGPPQGGQHEEHHDDHRGH